MNESTSPGPEIERALVAVRSVLTALAVATVFTVRATAATTRAELVGPLAIAAALGATAAGLFVAWKRVVAEDGTTSRRTQLVLQGLETLWFVALTLAVGTVMPDTAWVILVVPIVAASLRLSETAVLATWLVGAFGYMVGIQSMAEQSYTGGQEVLQRLGLLLAVAASVAVVTRWQREGWIRQAALSAEAQKRIERLSIIEDTATVMRTAELEAIPDMCLSAIVRLGFDAATMTSGKELLGAAGAGEIVPSGAWPEPSADDADAVDVTRWVGPSLERLFSVSMVERHWDFVFTGWTSAMVDDPLAHAFTEVVANTTNASAAAFHLRQAKFEATHDSLTSLPNRAELHRQIEAAGSSTGLVAIVFLDLDHFKPVNDTHGHLVGDGLLMALARRLADVVEDRGLVARYGGDEFVILLTGDHATHAAEIGESIRRSVLEPFIVDDIELNISGSLGVATAQAPLSATSLLDQADQAAYAAKDSGRNRLYVTRKEDRLAIKSTELADAEQSPKAH